MSKKTSKILVVAVVAILAVSMLAMVACGEKKGPEGPKALEPATAMKTLQDGFTAAKTKTVTEDIKVTGIALEGVAGLLDLWIDNVDIHMTRTYDNGVLNIKALIENLTVREEGLSAVLGMVSGIASGIPSINADTIAAFGKVKIEAEVDIDPDMVVTTKKFAIKNLNQVKDSKGKPIFYDGGDANGQNKKPLGAVYEPGELKDKTVDPRHESEGEGDLDGLFTAMDKWSANEAGTILETFLKDNYQMVSLYKFKNMGINGNAISADEATDYGDVYTVAQDVLDGYKDAKVKGDVTVGGILNTLFSTDQVADIIPQVAAMGNAKMTGEVKADGTTWKLVKMETKQNINVTITKDLILNAIQMLKDMDVMPANVVELINKVVANLEDITTPINVVTTATFNY